MNSELRHEIVKIVEMISIGQAGENGIDSIMQLITQSNLDLLKRLEEQKKRILLVADEQNKKVYSEKPTDGIELRAIARERERIEKEMK